MGPFADGVEPLIYSSPIILQVNVFAVHPTYRVTKNADKCDDFFLRISAVVYIIVVFIMYLYHSLPYISVKKIPFISFV